MACSRCSWTALVAAVSFLVVTLFVGPSGAVVPWPLSRYAPCGAQPLTGIDGVVTDAAFASDADILWAVTSSPAQVHRIRRSTGELLRTVSWDAAAYPRTTERSREGRKGIPTSGISTAGPNLGVAFLDEERIAVIDGEAPVITVLDFAKPDAALRRDFSIESIPVGTTLSHLAFDRAMEYFYAVPASNPRSLLRIDLHGEVTPLLDSSSDAMAMLGESSIASMHFSGNAGRLFVLTEGDSEPSSVHQITLKGRHTEVRVFSQFGGNSEAGQLKGLAFSRLGESMLLVSSEGPGKHVLHQMCQKIEQEEPSVLQPPKPYKPRPGFWYPIETYRPCSLPFIASFEGGQLNDLTVNPSSRTMWIATSAGLYEYSLTAELLRHVSSKQLADAAPGLGEVTSLAWLTAYQYVVGSSETNTLALLNTDPEATAEELAAAGVRVGGEPQSWEEDEEDIRRLNKIQVSGVFSVSEDLLPSGQRLGQLTVDKRAGFAFFSAEAGGTPRRVMYAAINGTASGVLLSEEALESANVTHLTDVLYSPARRSMLALSRDELVIKEIGSAGGRVAKEWKLPLYSGLPVEQRPKALHITPDGALMLLGSSSGMVQLYCSPEAEKSSENGDDDSRKTIRSLSFINDPVAWWLSVQNNRPGLPLPPSAATPAPTRAPWDPLADFGFPSPATSVGGLNLPNWFLSLPLLDLSNVFGTPPPTLSPTARPTPAPTPPPGLAPTPSPGLAPTPAPGLPGSGGLPPSNPPPAPTLPSAPTVPVVFQLLTGIGCKDPNLEVFRGIPRQQCEAECAARPQCRAYTHNQSGNCFLKVTCNDAQLESGDTSGVLDQVTLPTEENPPPPPSNDTPDDSSDDTPVEGSDDTPAEDDPPPPSLPPGPPGSSPPSWNTGDGGELVGPFDPDDFDDDECFPSNDNKCGLSENPGITVGGITWHRMFAHEANPLKDAGNGVVEWTPYRERRIYAQMYWKGSEILGFFDQPVRVNKNGETRLSFLWASEGEQVDVCDDGDAKSLDCDECEEEFGDEYGDEKNAYRYMYQEVRCYSGTGDFRVSILDSGGETVNKDGYGYFNDKFIDYKGLQWRFHPQACPEKPRAFHGPKEYVATSGSSWIRSNRGERKYKNQWSLGCDYVENSELGRRSFKDRMYSPDDGPMCLNLPNGELTDEDKPMTFIITHKGEDDGRTEFTFRMEFNGEGFEQTERWDTELFPETIDAISVSYTNSRSFFKMKLKRIE